MEMHKLKKYIFLFCMYKMANISKKHGNKLSRSNSIK